MAFELRMRMMRDREENKAAISGRKVFTTNYALNFDDDSYFPHLLLPLLLLVRHRLEHSYSRIIPTNICGS